MSSTIKHIRSAVAGRTPTTSQLELGELAINTTDGKVFIKKSVSGTETIIDIGGGSQTAAEILTAVKTVDGTGSGLDADTVDGIQASSFLRSDANDTATGKITFNNGIANGYLQGYYDYELLVDFGSDAANTDRRIISIASPTGLYSTIGFTIEIIDNNANHANASTFDDVCKETYYVHCVRTDATTANNPDQIYVSGPGSFIYGSKVSQGNYEVLIRNPALHKEYRISIKVHAVNGSHTVTYHNGDTPSSGTLVAPSTSTTSLEKFQGINFINANATGPIAWDGTLSTFDPPGGGTGTDTATDAAIALGSGHRIVGWSGGYIRSLFEWNSSSDITIGQGSTSMIGGINLMPGSSGVAKVNGNTIWHAGNDGAGSGLDADLLDGIQASSFLRSNASEAYAGGTLTINSHSSNGSYQGWGIKYSSSNWRHTNNNSYGYAIRNNGTTMSIKVSKEAGTTDSVASFNDYYFSGESTAYIKVGSNTVWHAGNDGTGSGLDADLLDGVQGSAYETKADKEFFSITNSGSTAGTWLGSHSDITAYFDGMTIAFYQNNLAGASTTTLNINSLGAKTIYYANDSKLTTHYGSRTLIMLQYDSDQDRFYAHDFYYSSDDYRIRWQNDLTAGSQIHGYQLLMEGTDGKMYPVTSGGSTGNTNTVQTTELRVGGLMLYYAHSTDYAADATITRNDLYTSLYTNTMEYWNNRDSGWATAHRPWYIVATMSNGNFVLDNTSYTSFLTQDLPTSDDGKFYIMGGWMHDTYDDFRIQVDHPIYVYKNGGIKTYTGYAGDADSQSPIIFNQNTVNSNITFASGYNGISVGPMEIATGVTVEIPQNSTWAVI